LQVPLTQIVPGRHGGSQQSGLPGGQQVRWIPSGLLTLVPGGQHPSLPNTRGFGQQTRPIVLADDRDLLPCSSRCVVVMQTSSLLQQPASPQHVSFSLVLQHLLPQHCSPLSQQVCPQQVCVEVQQ